MADNFNLRAFLTENKLTKNAQLLKEEDDYKYFDEEGTGGFYMATIDGVKIYSLEDSSIMDTCFYALEGPETTYMISIDVSGEPVDADYVEQDSGVTGKVAEFIANDINSQLEEEGGEEEYEDNLDEADWRNNPFTPHNFDGVARQAQQSKELQAVANRMFPEFGGELKDLGAPLTPDQRNAVWATWSKEKTERERSQVDDEEQANDIEQAQHDIERQYEPTVKENKMTQRDKYLTRLVENALGITPHEENPDHEFGTNKVTGEPLPNPKDTMVVEDEMADETVIPEYRTIDELMKSIDHGTNEVAEKHKMDQMKKIAEALRIKAKKMEESEHAAHISPKDLKQLATDAAKLEKAAEKLKAGFDKKFNKKEKPAAATKTEKVEALQEGFFDLRKFLAENRK